MSLFSRLVVDVYGRCNLRCRFCPEAWGLNDQPERVMSLAFFKDHIGPVLPGLEKLELFNWSEPFLHKQLFDIIDWAAEQNRSLEFRLSTNGTLIDEALAVKLVHSPVKALTITLAALSKPEYVDFHGVDALDKVVQSLHTLVGVRERLGAATPRLRIRYLRFPFNFVSTARVRQWVKKKLGSSAGMIDRISVREGYLCGTTLTEEEINRAYGIDPSRLPCKIHPVYPTCRRALEEPAVRADGAVFPCCAMPYREEQIMGFLGENSFEEIWNGPAYQKFRESFVNGNNVVCSRCYLRYPKVPVKLDRYFLHRLRWRS